MNKQSKVLAIGFVVCTTLLACNGGGNNNSSLPAAPNTQNQLQKYLSLWSYTPLAVNNNNKRLSSTIGNQLYMVESKDNSVTSMSLTFYSDSACTTALNTITFNGPTSVLAGTYHTTDQSNFYACNTMYSGGCVAELNANSSQYKYTFANGAFSYSYCLTNPATSGDKIADWSSGSAVSCSAGSSCGYSQPYTFALFPGVYWAKQVGAATGTTQGNSVAIDMLGNSYITGYTTLGISEQTQTGFGDYFIAKYTESGTLLWTK
ncbi:MAG TPA: SBBP repeat-containing protein [Burkholderiales bacterium]|nr:SBBP repeat-containing protein [Burkholderiales bacterium]